MDKVLRIKGMAAAARVDIFLLCAAFGHRGRSRRMAVAPTFVPEDLKSGRRKAGGPMRYSRIRARQRSGPSRYTHLSACVSEEEEGFTVEVRLFDEAKPEHAACSEEVADSFETASALLGALAAAFAIPQAHVKIRIRMDNPAAGTQH